MYSKPELPEKRDTVYLFSWSNVVSNQSVFVEWIDEFQIGWSNWKNKKEQKKKKDLQKARGSGTTKKYSTLFEVKPHKLYSEPIFADFTYNPKMLIYLAIMLFCINLWPTDILENKWLTRNEKLYMVDEKKTMKSSGVN